MLLTDLFHGTQGLHMSVSSPWQIRVGAIWRRTQNSIVYRMNHHIPKYSGVCKIKNQMLWGLPQSQPPKLNHVLTISWAAQTTTLANNPRLEHIKSWIRTFPAHFMCWRAEHMSYVLAPFRMDKCIFSKKHVFCILGARWHKILEFAPSCSIYGWLAWWCDFFPVGPTFEDHQHVFSQKRSSPLEFIFDTCASASSSHLFWLVKLNICGCSLLLGQNYFQQKTFVLHCGRALTQNSWICPIMSYLWMVGLVMRLFSCWANLWRSSPCIQPKKVQPLGIYFWQLCLGLSFNSLTCMSRSHWDEGACCALWASRCDFRDPGWGDPGFSQREVLFLHLPRANLWLCLFWFLLALLDGPRSFQHISCCVNLHRALLSNMTMFSCFLCCGFCCWFFLLFWFWVLWWFFLFFGVGLPGIVHGQTLDCVKVHLLSFDAPNVEA